MALVGVAFDLAFALGGLALAALTARHAWIDPAQRRVFDALLIGFGLRLLWLA